MYEQSLGIHSRVCGELYNSLFPESSSPRRTRKPDSYVYWQLKTSVCGHSLVGVIGSNTAVATEGLCVVRKRFLRRADHPSRGILPSVVCLIVIVKPQYRGDPVPLGVRCSN